MFSLFREPKETETEQHKNTWCKKTFIAKKKKEMLNLEQHDDAEDLLDDAVHVEQIRTFYRGFIVFLKCNDI